MSPPPVIAPESLFRALPLPGGALKACVVVPVRDEEETLAALLQALAGQQGLDGRPVSPESFEVLLLLNNCVDESRAVAERQRALYPDLPLRVVEVTLPSHEAHVGRARQLLFETACHRLPEDGVILSTDADTAPAPNWFAETMGEFAHGVDGVGGRITLFPEDLSRLSEGVRRSFLLDIGYRRALEEMRALYAPEAHDPFPRHHQHFGGSLAVTVRAYRAAGGMPALRTSEDVALYRAVLASGGKFRHSYRVRTETSARFIGRAQGGLADALNWWDRQCRQHAEVRVESAVAAERRLARLGLWQAASPGVPLPWALLATPEPPPPGEDEALTVMLPQLRARNAALRAMPLAQRLAEASARLEAALA